MIDRRRLRTTLIVVALLDLAYFTVEAAVALAIGSVSLPPKRCGSSAKKSGSQRKRSRAQRSTEGCTDATARGGP